MKKYTRNIFIILALTCAGDWGLDLITLPSGTYLMLTPTLGMSVGLPVGIAGLIAIMIYARLR